MLREHDLFFKTNWVKTNWNRSAIWSLFAPTETPQASNERWKKHEMTGNESRVIFPVKGKTYFIPSKKLITLEDSISEDEKERLKLLFLKALISWRNKSLQLNSKFVFVCLRLRVSPAPVACNLKEGLTQCRMLLIRFYLSMCSPIFQMLVYYIEPEREKIFGMRTQSEQGGITLLTVS